MLSMPTDLQVGQVVYLYASTKQASNACHRNLTVKVMKDPAAHWPRVMVSWREDGQDKWELVHKQNIRVRRPDARVRSEEKGGDTAQDNGNMSRWAAVRVMPGKPKPIGMPPNANQGELF